MNTDKLKLQEQVLGVIRQNLPEQVATEMKSFIEEAEQNKQLIKAQNDVITRLMPFEKKALDAEAKESSLKIKELAIEAREKAAEKAEFELKLKEKDYQLAAKESVISNMFTIMQLFVKNPRSIEIVAESRNNSISAIDQYGSYRNTGSSNENVSRAVEKVESKGDYINTGTANLPINE